MQTLAKIQITAIFLMQDMRRNFLPKFIEICMEFVGFIPKSLVLRSIVLG